jgi:hypothetical protein
VRPDRRAVLHWTTSGNAAQGNVRPRYRLEARAQAVARLASAAATHVRAAVSVRSGAMELRPLILLSLQQALLGMVTPDLRAVEV